MNFISMVLAVAVIGGLLSYMNSSTKKDKPSNKAGDFDPTAQKSAQPVLDTEFVQRHWTEIHQMMKSGGAGLKSALIEADKLLDYVMQAKGLKGDTMGDRLKLNGKKFSDLNGIWSAHKLRNQYVHDVHIDVVPREVEQAVARLGQGMKDLGIVL